MSMELSVPSESIKEESIQNDDDSDDSEEEEEEEEKIETDVLTNPTYFGVVMAFLTPLEYVQSVARLSRFHHDFLQKDAHCVEVQRIFCREFGPRLCNLFFLQPSVAYLAVSLFYQTWSDEAFMDHALFRVLNKGERFKTQFAILEKLQAEHFMVRMHIFRPTLYALKHWFRAIAASVGTDIAGLGFDTENNCFAVLSPPQRRNGDGDSNQRVDDNNDEVHLAEQQSQTLNSHVTILSTHRIDMNPKMVHFSAAVLSVCMARIPSIFNAAYFGAVQQWLEGDCAVRLEQSHFYEVLWMSLDDAKSAEWAPLILSIVLDGFERKLRRIERISAGDSENVGLGASDVLKLNLEWVFFMLHLFIAIHKTLCDQAIVLNADGAVDVDDEAHQRNVDAMRCLLSLRDCDRRVQDLGKRISPNPDSTSNLMERIFILASTWPTLSPNEIRRSIKVATMFAETFAPSEQ